MIFDINTFFSMDTLIIAFLAIIAFLIFDFVQFISRTVETARIFKKIKSDHKEFLIEYSDCYNYVRIPSLSYIIAFFKNDNKEFPKKLVDCYKYVRIVDLSEVIALYIVRNF